MSTTPVRTTSHASVATTTGGGAGPSAPPQRVRRPTEFRLLDGRRVVVALPEDVPALRTKYGSVSGGAGGGGGGGGGGGVLGGSSSSSSSSSRNSPPVVAGVMPPAAAMDPEVAAARAAAGLQTEVVVHGSAEHEALLRESVAQHEARRAHLRESHGGELLDEWDNVGRQLDSAAAALDGLGKAAHNAGSAEIEDRLRHNFSRFGYMAEIMVRDDHSGGPPSGARTPVAAASRAGSVAGFGENGGAAGGGGAGGGGGGGGASDAASGFMPGKNEGSTMKLFKRPVVKQYFHQGLLWRFSEETKVMSFELFFDLLYVGIIAVNGDHVSEEPTAHELLRFVVTFVMSWKIWSDVSQLVSWFETDDVLQRVEILFLIACLLGFTTNMLQTFNEDYDTYLQLVAFYISARLFMAAYCAITAALVPMVSGMMLSVIGMTVLSSALWIASIHVEMPHRLGLTFVALCLDIFGQTPVVAVFRFGRSHAARSKIAARLNSFFEFYPAINIEHKVERTNAFVGLIFGYSVVGLIYQNAAYGINAFIGKAVLGLIQAYIFNWLYFEIDGENLYMHAIRRSPEATFLWSTAHIPFICAYVLGGAALSKLVVAHDSPNSPLDTLTDFYQHRSVEELDDGLRWFYGAGMGVALMCMGFISISHRHRHPPTQYLSKPLRLANRFAVCAVFVCLPLAHGLNSLELIGVGTSLTVWVLVVEIWGKSCRDDPFVGEREGCALLKYEAMCTRRDLEKVRRDVEGEGGLDVDVYELGRGEKTAIVDVT